MAIRQLKVKEILVRVPVGGEVEGLGRAEWGEAGKGGPVKGLNKKENSWTGRTVW